MMARRARSAASGTRAMSTPSTRMAPACSSASLKSATRSDDLPAPVRPHTPSFSPGASCSETPRSTSGSPAR